jgi:HEPN domain-containing protein
MHLSSARILATTEDAAAAFVTAYDAARKSLSAMLAVQGLRARGGDGGHRVLSELMQAQLPRHRRILREFDWMRHKRNDTQYPDPDKPTAQRTTSPMASPPHKRSLSWEGSSWNSSPPSARQGRSFRSGGRCLPGPALLSSAARTVPGIRSPRTHSGRQQPRVPPQNTQPQVSN